ncbi:cytochrome P450 [Saccharopolyspora rhizosphaerae]|uniref:Cytochrome P450 n=1 Tax=Saccharopolyspora rhizosphaerae TaxID=2492662 RepID=A0A3R8Q6I8_9PSEU|nr:cytochrome P450 [Saccharopolyspora rhizosphaerae]RRO14254.1 cytochrome P450 [Saccharopolyspora rhizosphaerae]
MTMTTPSWIADVTVEELERDPYPFYERLRAEAPLAYVPALGCWVASTKEMCQRIAGSDDSDFEGVIAPAGRRTFGDPAVLDANGAEHDDLRAMVDPGLQPSEVDRYVDGLARPIARRYLEAFEDDGKADLVAQYCEPVSVRSLGDLMGLQSVSSDKLREWFRKLSVSFTNAGVDENGDWAHPDGFRPGDEAKAEIRAVVDPLLDKWTVEPDDSALSHWLHDGMPPGQVRDRDVIYPNIFVFLLGAMQEPGHAMATTIAGLFTRPDQLERVIDDPSLVRRAITEGVRWASPIWSAVARRNHRDMVIDGIELPAGSVVMMSYGSANHDEADYSSPAAFDLDRTPVPNLAFGAGKHACAGTYFATEVVRIALEELFEAIPNLQPAAGHEVGFWGWGFRGPVELHAEWEV